MSIPGVTLSQFVSKTMAEDPIGVDFNWDDKRFMEIVWPELAEFIPEMEVEV